MKDSLTPEEKLLKLIKGDKKKKPEPDFAMQAGRAEEKINPEASSIKTSQKIPAAILSPARLRPLDIHKVIIIVAVASIMFLIAAFMYPVLGLNRVKLPLVATEEQPLAATEVKPEVQPLDSYLSGLKSKQIFSVAPAQDATTSPAAVSNTLDLIKDITLVGIITSEPPQAVIEDTKTQKTYYLSKGQSIGDLMVEDIKEGKVILNYLGTKYELYM